MEDRLQPQPEAQMEQRQPAEQMGVAAMLQQLLASQQQQQESQERQAQEFKSSQQQLLASQQQQTEQSKLSQQQQLESQQEFRTQITASLAEHSERLECRIIGQLSQETEKIRSAFQREMMVIGDRVEAVERGQNLQQQQLCNQQQRLDRFDSLIGEQRNQLKQVGDEMVALSGRLDAVQRETYQRVSAIEGGRVTEAIDSTGLSRSVTPLSAGCPVKIKTRPAPFDGKTSWVGYRAQFDLISELNCWSLSERAQYLAASLAGPALTVLTNLSVTERLSYDHLTEALNTRFNEGRSAELARVKLDQRRQLANEKLAQYASEIESLTQLAYPTAGGEARDILTRERFLKGLLSSELRKQIKLSRAVTFADMLGTAIELDAVLQCEGDSFDRANYRRPIVRQVREEIGSPQKRARGACFRCGSLSHQRAQCNASADQLSPRSSNVIGNSRRNVPPANTVSRTRRVSESSGEHDSLGETVANEHFSNSPVDIASVLACLSKRVDALTNDCRQRDDSGRGRRSGSVPRRGECFECGSGSHYRNRCPLLQSAQPLN
jgi:hypothetical protein